MICIDDETSLFLNNNVEKIMKWLEKIFSFHLDIDINIEKYKVLGMVACSKKGRVYISEELLNYKKAMVNLYLPHELIHQYLGIYIFFKGKYSKFILEIMVEFLQYFYLKSINNDVVYLKYLKRQLINNKVYFLSDEKKLYYYMDFVDDLSFNRCLLLGVYMMVLYLNDFELYIKLLKNIVKKKSYYTYNHFMKDIECVYGYTKRIELSSFFNTRLTDIINQIEM